MNDADDQREITDLLIRYATGIDTRDWPLFRTVFADDCRLDYGDIGSWTGVDAVTEFMIAAHAAAGYTMHRITNPAVTVEGDTARARAYVDALIMAPDNASGVSAAGYYDDEFVRTTQGWRLHRRRFTTVMIRPVG